MTWHSKPPFSLFRPLGHYLPKDYMAPWPPFLIEAAAEDGLSLVEI